MPTKEEMQETLAEAMRNNERTETEQKLFESYSRLEDKVKRLYEKLGINYYEEDSQESDSRNIQLARKY